MHINKLIVFGLLGLGICSIPYTAGLRAAVANVSIGDDFFSPTSTNINVGDEVKWTWIGSVMHSTTSNTGLWDSGIHAGGEFTFSNSFPSAGNFPYHCNVHAFMVASITVQAASTPPTVTLTNPPNGEILSAPATITLAASASDSGGSVTNVQFFQGATSLGNVPASPYSLTVSNLGAADYNFSAVAMNNQGQSATNTITIHVITASPIVLSGPERPSATSFQFTYSANAGLRYVVQRSADLVAWTALNTNTAAGTSVLFQDASAPGGQNFYRVALLPNP